MLHDIFLHIHQSLDELEHGFQKANNIDQELSLLEKYLSIKEISEDITVELNKLNQKIDKFEREHGLTEVGMELNEYPVESKYEQENDEVVIELDEDDFLTFQKGIGFFDLFMYDKAISHLKQTISKYPDFNLARLYTAMTYFKNNDYLNAKNEINTMFKFCDDPDLLSLGHNILGMVFSSEDEDQAIFHYKNAIDLKNNWHEPKFNLAILFYKQKRYKEAKDLFHQLLNNDPNDWEVLLYLGKTYQMLRDIDTANEYFKRTYSIAKHPIVINKIANYFQQRKEFKQANTWYKRWAQLEPNNEQIWLKISKNYWLSGDKSLGVTTIKKVLSLNPTHTEALIFYLWMQTEHDKEKAFKILDKMLNSNLKVAQEDSYFIANIARLLAVHDDIRTKHFCSILYNSSNSTYRGLGYIVDALIALDQNRPQNALTSLNNSLKEGLRFPHLDFYLGYSHYLLGQTEEAKKHWTNLTL